MSIERLSFGHQVSRIWRTQMNMPSINWFGGMMVTRSLLEWSKSGIEDDSPESFVAKMNRPNLIRKPSTNPILSGWPPKR